MTIDPIRQQLLACDGPLLVCGGPGSGKTTIALHKALSHIEGHRLRPGQRVLFLSFARATVGRIAETALRVMSNYTRASLEISTYHSFSWQVLKAHGYLLGQSSRPTRLLTPADAAKYIAHLDKDVRPEELLRLFDEQSLLHFDLFAMKCAELFRTNNRLRQLYCDTYPIVLLDEFQDTDIHEWSLLQQIGRGSCLIALADPDQRIYEFRGADPARIGQFVSQFRPTLFDFGSENNRSNGTDIVSFGNDLLVGRVHGRIYNNVSVVSYTVRRGTNNHYDLKRTVLSARQRLARRSSWSLAVLVPTNRLMTGVSDYLSGEEHQLPRVSHRAAVDTAGPMLASLLVASVLELRRPFDELCTHIRGRSGNKGASAADGDLADALERYAGTGHIVGKNRKAVASEFESILAQCAASPFGGDPLGDWRQTVSLFLQARSTTLRQVGVDASYSNLVRAGSPACGKLAEAWKTRRAYTGAHDIIRSAATQEYFAGDTHVARGIHLMTMHKGKGKEFDEVIVYEGTHANRYVSARASPDEAAKARRTLRVALTRARERATILTPSADRSSLLC